MKKIIFYLLFVFLAYTSYAQELPTAPNKTKNGLRKGKWVVWFTDKWQPTTQKELVAYYRVMKYKKGKIKNHIKAYRLNGTMQWEGNFNSDNLDCASGGCMTCLCEGLITFYDEKGNISSKTIYANGQQQTNIIEQEIKTAIELYKSQKYKEALYIFEKYEVFLFYTYDNDTEKTLNLLTILETCYEKTSQSKKAKKTRNKKKQFIRLKANIQYIRL